MTRIAITDLKFIEDALDLKGPIEEMLWEELDQPHAWESVGQIAAQLESASCAAGSWSEMIYTRDILDKLSDPKWVDAIDEAIAQYEDATGEQPTFSPTAPSTYRLWSLSQWTGLPQSWPIACAVSTG